MLSKGSYKHEKNLKMSRGQKLIDVVQYCDIKGGIDEVNRVFTDSESLVGVPEELKQVRLRSLGESLLNRFSCKHFQFLNLCNRLFLIKSYEWERYSTNQTYQSNDPKSSGRD